jgi:hypothetical protein
MFAPLRLSGAVFTAFAFLALLPGAARGEESAPQVPTQPPPICGMGKPLILGCPAFERTDLYPKASCPNQAPKDLIVCLKPTVAPLVGMRCYDYQGYFQCEALPESPTGELTYAWTSNYQLVVHASKDPIDPVVFVSCGRGYGYGALTLTVTASSGASSTVTEFLDCQPW